MILEWIKLAVTIVFIILIILVLIRKTHVLKWLTTLVILHSVIIFSLRFFVSKESLVDAVLSVVYFIIIIVAAYFIYGALKYNDKT